MKKRMKRHAIIQPLDKPYRLIALTQGQNAIVDTADFEWLDQFNWCAVWNPSSRKFYASRGHHISMHQVLCGHIGIDHADGNSLNNRRSNLRQCTQSQNNSNRRKMKSNQSGFKGVEFMRLNFMRVPGCRPWLARIGVNDKRIYLGVFASAKEAAHAYDTAARKYFGEFAQLNFP